MKTVVIINPVYKEGVVKLLTDAVVRMDDARKSETVLSRRNSKESPGGDENFQVIETMEEYDTFNFMKFFDQDFAQCQVFITPDLFWKEFESPVDEGYEIALDLLENKLKDKRFFLHFVSIYRQEQLLKLTTPIHSMMVESFPHHCLNDSHVSDGFSFHPYSEIHFELIKRIAISKSGIIDKLWHDVGHLDDGNDFEVLKERAQRILKVLTVFDQVAPQAEALSDQLEEIDNMEEAGPLIDRLRALVNSVKAPEHEAVASGYNVLVIEDDPNDRKQLCEFFQKHFNHVTCNDECDLKLSEAPKWMLKEAKSCQLVVLDLFYQDERHCWLPFSGLDLYELLLDHREELPCAIRVVTGLPRNEVSKVIENIIRYKIPVEHLYSKADGIQHAIGWMEGRLMDIVKECDEIAKRKALLINGPKNGAIFTLGAQHIQKLREMKSQEMPSQSEFGSMFHAVMAEVENVADNGGKWDRTLGKKGTENHVARSGNKRFETRLKNLLRFRAFVLHYCVTYGKCIEIAYFRTVLDSVSKGLTPVAKMQLDGAFFNRLGFSCTKEIVKDDNGIDEGDYFNIDIAEDQLYPEEWKYCQDLQLKLRLSTPDMTCFSDEDVEILGWLDDVKHVFYINEKDFRSQIGIYGSENYDLDVLDLIDEVLPNRIESTKVVVHNLKRLLELLRPYTPTERGETDYIAKVFRFGDTNLYTHETIMAAMKERCPQVLDAYMATFPNT